MTGPAGVLALVLAEASAGSAALLFCSPIWGEVRRGFFYLTGAVILVFALATWGAARAGTSQPAGGPGRLAVVLSLALAGATALWLVLLLARAGPAARVVGALSVPLSVAMLVAFARTADESAGLAVFQMLAGAALIGGVVDGLLLGHWYLTDRSLSRTPINRYAWALIAACVLDAAAVLAGGFGSSNQAGSSATAALNPVLTIGGVTVWIALGMVVVVGLLAGMIKLALRTERATGVQSATGFFWLAVGFAFTAEIAAKVRFLP